MLAIRLRVRPWRARWSPRSVGRETVRVPSSIATVISRLTLCSRAPFGPFTLTAPGLTSISTPSGISIGFRPIRLISNSPDVCDDLAAHALLTRLVARHHPTRGGHDRRAHAAEDAGHVLIGNVASPAGARDALHAADHGTAVLGVAEPNLEDLTHATGLDAEVSDVALL